MHHYLVLLLTIAGTFAGCLAPPSPSNELPDASAPDPSAEQPPAGPTQPAQTAQPARKDFVLVPGKTETIRIDFAGGPLSGKIATTNSAYSDFRVSGAGSCGGGLANVNAVIAGNSTAGFSCGDVPKGVYTLTFGITAGVAIGNLTVERATLAA